MKELVKRIITAVILFFFVIAILLIENAKLTTVLIMCVTTLCFFEFVKMLKLGKKAEGVLLFFALCICPAIFAFLKVSLQTFFVLNTMLVLTIGFFFNRNDIEKVKEKTFLYLLYFILIGIGGYSLMIMANMKEHSNILIWLLMVVSINDVFAFAGGKSIGGEKFNVAISPNKTISGSVCGILSAIVISICLKYGLDLNVKSGFVWVTVITVWAAQMGDLIESLIKRAVGVKDSSNLLPGHGGVLDRVDAIFGAAPFALIYFF